MREEEKTWFDDPEWERLRREVHNRPVYNPSAKLKSPSAMRQPDEGPKKVNVSINLTIPDIRLDKLKQLAENTRLKQATDRLLSGVKSVRPSRRQLVIGGAACLVLITSFTGLKALGGRKNDSGKVDVATGVLGDAAREPEFETVLPDGNKDATLSDRFAYDAEKKVASFTDKINGVPITVSQQPLPPNFQEDPDGQVEKLAKNFNATKKISANGETAYLGTSAQGPQSLVMRKSNLLVFIFSEQEISEQIWGEYIARLE